MSPNTRIRSMRFGNYKAFPGRHALDVRPITVVFGRNGSGKSVLTRLPLALSAALRGGESPGLSLRVNSLTYGSSLLSFSHGGTADSFEIGVSTVAPSGLTVDLDLTLSRDPATPLERPAQWVQSWQKRTDVETIRLDWDRGAGRYRDGSGNLVQEALRFRGFVPFGAAGPHPMAWNLMQAYPFVAHIGPVRSIGPDSFVQSLTDLPSFVGLAGEHTRAVLGAHYSHRRDAVIAQVREDLLRILNVELDVREVGEGLTRGTLALARPRGRDTWLDAGELGTGLAHALPVLVQHALVTAAGADDSVPSMIVCEEPEAHLTYGAQAEMADVIVAAAQTGRCDCLVETHSETFLLRLQRRVAEGVLAPDQVAIWWVDDEGDTTEPRALHIQSDGSIPDWPENWFGAALDEVRAIHRGAIR